MRGDLRQSSLADLMRHVYAERKSGVLSINRQGVRRNVHFKRGVAIFADADAGDGDGQVPGREQALRLLYSLFSWTSGEFTFENKEPVIDEGMAITESPAALILEGSRRIDDEAVLNYLIGGASSCFSCAESSVLPIFTMKLSPGESAILKFARERERFTPAELPFKAGGLPLVNALNALVSVGLLDIVEKEAVPPPAARETQPPEPSVTVPPERESHESHESPEPQQTAADQDIESLLDAYDARRTRTPVLPQAVQSQPRPLAPASPSLPPPVETSTPSSPSTASTSVPSDGEGLVDTLTAQEELPPLVPFEPRPATQAETELPPDKPASSAVAAAPTMAPSPSPSPSPPPPPPVGPRSGAPPAAAQKPSALSALADRLPRGKTGAFVAVAVGIVGLVVLVSWFLSGGGGQGEPELTPDSDSDSDPVVAAAAAPSEREPASLDPSRRSGPTPEPSDAELFYAANVAFERDELEASKAALVTLLERRPDFRAAADLMDRVEQALADDPDPDPELDLDPDPEPDPEPPRKTTSNAPARPPRKLADGAGEAVPATAEAAEAAQTTAPEPSRLFGDARTALGRGDLDGSRAKLDELDRLHPSYPGAARLRDELDLRLWERKLPITLRVRHDHALGGCSGVLSLTSTGFAYRSQDHEWIWSFFEVLEVERRDARRLRVETKARASFNFELEEGLAETDWSRHQALWQR